MAGKGRKKTAAEGAMHGPWLPPNEGPMHGPQNAPPGYGKKGKPRARFTKNYGPRTEEGKLSRAKRLPTQGGAFRQVGGGVQHAPGSVTYSKKGVKQIWTRNNKIALPLDQLKKRAVKLDAIIREREQNIY